ncbi:MAG: dTMP kinase [Prevotellaceae bacterium]|jgi:dTMP kinase|nr:dTMP kinase [Prevotellaceae bacterium]
MNFIAIEGLDGAGKSTQVALLQQHLQGLGVRCKYLHFPRIDAPIWGALIAKFLRGDLGKIGEVDPYLVALLYAEDRRAAAKEIRGWMQEGYFVIVDRYVYSNVAFQCAKLPHAGERCALREWILNLEYGHFEIPKPQRSFFLDVPFSFTQEKLSGQRRGDDRRYLDGKEDIHEADLDFQRAVRSVYLAQPALDADFCVIKCYSELGEMLEPSCTFNKIISNIQIPLP